MNNDMIQKNLEYQEKIHQIAKMLFHAFYYDEEELLSSLPNEDLTAGAVCEKTMTSPLPGEKIYEDMSIVALSEKAEKLLQFFESIDDAKKTIKFLRMVNLEKSKAILDEM